MTRLLTPISIILLVAQVLVISQLNSAYIQTNAQTDVLTTKLQKDKAAVQNQISTINSVLRDRSTALLDISSRKNNLQAEIAARNDSIRSLDENITNAKLAEAQITEQIKQNELKRTGLIQQMELIIPQIQIESNKTDLQAIIESDNISQLMRKLYGLSTLQVELDRIDSELDDINKELEENKKQQAEARIAAENSKFLLKSEQDGLQLLLEQTQGQESQYQSLIADLRIQKREQESQISQLEAEYQQEIAKRKAEEERQRIIIENQKTNTPSDGTSVSIPNPSNGSTGGNTVSVPIGNCRFEDGRTLPVRLAKPTTGFISDTFGCPSVTGRWHDGYDIANGQGTPIFAAYGGVVERKGYDGSGFGNYIMIRHEASGTVFFTLYAHMQSQSVIPVGSVVGQGAEIGYMGSTGWSTGPHLHFMIYSDTYNTTGSLGCTYGSTKCFNPIKFTNF